MSYNITTRYCKDSPSNQSLIDSLEGSWKSKFPSKLNIKAGVAPYFEKDRRVDWVKENFISDFSKMNILEFGPFEAYNTYRLSQENPKSLTAIEGNNINFLKCLVVKELLDFKAKFIHGDFTKYLQSDHLLNFDLVWVSGVLYHQINPVRFIELLARITSKIFIWTHYFDPSLQDDKGKYPQFDKTKDTTVLNKHNAEIPLYYRRYMHLGEVPTKFSGGKELHANWLARKDLFALLEANGFGNIHIMNENLNHKAGPSIAMYCTKN